MQPDQELIDRFYHGECTSREAKLVMDWLLENEQESSLTKEWAETSAMGDYPEEYPAEMLAFIEANKFTESDKAGQRAAIRRFDAKSGSIRLPWKQGMVAASVLLVACLSFILWNKGKRTDKGIPALAAKQQDLAAMTPRLVAVNASARRQSTIRLADGSTVILSPGAVLRYDSLAYNQRDRMFYLSGQAAFTVAAEKDKPFSVNANGFSTTALGTSFMVTTQSSDAIRVRLYSGKVVIRHTGPFSKPMQDVYLKPGEELVYNNSQHQSLVSRFEPLNARPGPAGRIRKDIQISGDTLVFHNAPLADVLNLLCKRYHVRIQYDRHILSDVYFTGQALPGDAIELLLKTVTRINNLTLIAAGDGFIIK
jgi:ferric-dicitrate binding protein FerR (iron transport regulator)